MGWTQSTAPTEEVVTPVEAKLHLRVRNDDENDLIRSLTIAAREDFEGFTVRQLVTASYTETWDTFPLGTGKNSWIRPTWAPLASVTSVAYIDTDGVSQTFAASKYDVDTKMEPGRIALAHNESWPSTRSDIEAVTVVYTAGYGAATAVPHSVKKGIKLILGHSYLNRESVVDVKLTEVPGLKTILWRYRV